MGLSSTSALLRRKEEPGKGVLLPQALGWAGGELQDTWQEEPCVFGGGRMMCRGGLSPGQALPSCRNSLSLSHLAWWPKMSRDISAGKLWSLLILNPELSSFLLLCLKPTLHLPVTCSFSLGNKFLSSLAMGPRIINGTPETPRNKCLHLQQRFHSIDCTLNPFLKGKSKQKHWARGDVGRARADPAIP